MMRVTSGNEPGREIRWPGSVKAKRRMAALLDHSPRMVPGWDFSKINTRSDRSTEKDYLFWRIAIQVINSKFVVIPSNKL